MAIDALGPRNRIVPDTFRNGAAVGIGAICGQRVALVKPMTYMNRSGEPTGSLLVHWGLTCREMIVIHDDMDLAFGRIKIKTKGGDGGHRGIRSLVDACGDDRFCRIRVGIGRSAPDVDAVDHVLGGFDVSETAALGGIIDTVRDAAIAVLCEGAEVAMNRYNRRSSDNS
jgi:PTH1 family peptidyl-tRNA hydrolase